MHSLMFTGIIEELGEVKQIARRGNATWLEIKNAKALEGAKNGDSISVNGACLTVVKKSPDSLSFEVIPQTLKATNLGGLKTKEKVNLERALKLGDRLSGHFVTGHIDCLGAIRKKTFSQGNLCCEIAIPVKFMPYIIPQGSVAIDGISLTIAEKKNSTFTVCIIPHTFKNTTLGQKEPSDLVNIEFDILAKRSVLPHNIGF